MTAEDKNSPPGASKTPTACTSSRKPDEDAVAVRVAVNIRPLVEQELAKGCQEILDVTPGIAQVLTYTYGRTGSMGALVALVQGDSSYNRDILPCADSSWPAHLYVRQCVRQRWWLRCSQSLW